MKQNVSVPASIALSPILRILLSLFAIMAFAEAAAAADFGAFVATGEMTVPRARHAATLLQDGSVLITGGHAIGSPDFDSRVAEIFDPGTGVFRRTGSMSSERYGHTATLLPDGRVLVAGGEVGFASNSTAEIYDPDDGRFVPTGAMLKTHHGATATLLPDGKVLIAGGYHEPIVDGISADPEIYHPFTGTFTAAGTAYVSDDWGSTVANALPDGRVLLTGLNPPEIFDSSTRTFRPASRMASEDYQYGAYGLAGANLRNGDVLVSGGSFGFPCVAIDAAEIYDSHAGRFRTVEARPGARKRHTATALRDGRVLIAGGQGSDCNTALAAAQLFDPSGELFRPAGQMIEARYDHTATLLNDGTVLISGGYAHSSNGRPLRSAELFRVSTSTNPDTCIPDLYRACLLGRFAVEVRYRRGFDNSPPDSQAMAKSAPGFAEASYQTGFFYFNSPSNVEVMVKMLDQGNQNNGTPTIAVITGVATPLRIEVTVTDTGPGGGTQVYSSAYGSQRGVSDFFAFPK